VLSRRPLLQPVQDRRHLFRTRLHARNALLKMEQVAVSIRRVRFRGRVHEPVAVLGNSADLLVQSGHSVYHAPQSGAVRRPKRRAIRKRGVPVAHHRFDGARMPQAGWCGRWCAGHGGRHWQAGSDAHVQLGALPAHNGSRSAEQCSPITYGGTANCVDRSLRTVTWGLTKVGRRRNPRTGARPRPSLQEPAPESDANGTRTRVRFHKMLADSFAFSAGRRMGIVTVLKADPGRSGRRFRRCGLPSDRTARDSSRGGAGGGAGRSAGVNGTRVNRSLSWRSRPAAAT